ncbi:MAG TPA: cyclic nucleotide-binding domain-containing protein [Acidimicrobiales bacterium]
MRTESSVTSLSWIPSEAVRGGTRMAFDAGFTHYDEPPPDVIEDIEELRKADRFRFANLLAAWAEWDAQGTVTGCGYSGGGLMGSTTVAVGALSHEFEAVALPVIQQPPEVAAGRVRFVQTAGGRTGLPAPRRVRRKPFIQWQAPLVWATLALTLHAEGPPEFEVLGASRFPRHWFYDADGTLAAKSGLTDFKDWYRKSFGKHTPWGDQDSPALVTAVESALERALSTQMMGQGSKPKYRKLSAGDTLVREGDRGTDVFLVLDGVVRVDKAGERLAEYGPGAVLGERAGIEGGVRTSTLVAVTDSRVAVVPHQAMDRDQLHELAEGHRRESQQA